MVENVERFFPDVCNFTHLVTNKIKENYNIKSLFTECVGLRTHAGGYDI